MPTILTQRETDFIERILNEHFKYGNVQSNSNFVIDAIEAAGLRHIDITESAVRSAIERVAPQLAVNPGYDAAFRQFFSQNPSLNLQANENILCQAIKRVPGAKVTPENLTTAANHPQVNAQLTVTQASRDATAAEASHIQQLTSSAKDLSNMVLDLTAHFFNPETGEPKGKSPYERALRQREIDKQTELLNSLAPDQLSQKHAEWKYRKDLESKSVEEVRAIVKADDAKRRESYTEFQKIGTHYNPPGKPDVEINWSPELFKRLPSLEVRRLFKVFGEAQLTAVIQNTGGK